MGNEKDIELKNVQIDDDELGTVSGGKQVTENLVYQKKRPKKIEATIQKGEPGKAGNLLYKEEKSSDRPCIPFDETKLC